MPDFDQAQRPAQLGYILTDLLIRYNMVLQRSATEQVNLDLIVHGTQGHCSTFTDRDDVFRREWQEIQDERNSLHKKKGFADYSPGGEGWEPEDLAFRVREMSCLERSAYRMGVISKLETNVTNWNPIPVEVEV